MAPRGDSGGATHNRGSRAELLGGKQLYTLVKNTLVVRVGCHVLNRIAALTLCISVTGLIGRNTRTREAWERLQGDPVIHLVKRKTDAETGEFDQVA